MKMTSILSKRILYNDHSTASDLIRMLDALIVDIRTTYLTIIANKLLKNISLIKYSVSNSNNSITNSQANLMMMTAIVVKQNDLSKTINLSIEVDIKQISLMSIQRITQTMNLTLQLPILQYLVAL